MKGQDSQVAPPRAGRILAPAVSRAASSEAVAAAEAVARRVRNREAPVRRLFVERRDAATPTPLARMLRGGRGGQVRLKLYLSMLWFAAAPPHDVSYPHRAWATLLDLPDPDSNGARRVGDALSWLHENRFLQVQPVAGHPSKVTLLREDGSGHPYEVPAVAYNTLERQVKNADDVERDHLKQERDNQRYVRLPPQFWTSGYLALLSGPAVAMLLVLLTHRRPDSADDSDLWFSPGLAAKKYSLSEDTRSSGLRQLTQTGIVTMRRRPVDGDVFDLRRMRNVYQLSTTAFDNPAHLPSSSRDSGQ